MNRDGIDQDKQAASNPSGSSSRGSHRLSEATGCELKYALNTYYGFKSIMQPPWQLIGSLVHNCLAYHYGERLDIRPQWLDVPLESQLLQTAGLQTQEVQNALDVYAAYKHFYAGESWKPLYVEHEFKSTVGELDPGGPFPELDEEPITCRSDLVVEQNGDTWVVDHKCSAGSWNKPQLDPWNENGDYRVSLQALVNLHVLRKRLGNVRGFVIQRIKRKPPYDFSRNALKIPLRIYEKTPRMLRMMVKREVDIIQRLEAGEKPSPNYSACIGRYGACQYIDFCCADSDESASHILSKEFVQIGGLRK